MKNNAKTPGIEHTPGGALTFSGITPTIQPYAIEIANPKLAALWVHYLGRHKYQRYCFSYEKRQELIEATRDVSL